MDRRCAIGLGLMSGAMLAAPAFAGISESILIDDAGDVVPLWPGTPPGGEGVNLSETVVEASPTPGVFHERSVRGIGKPALIVYRPARPNGSALLLIPGGGYNRQLIDREADEGSRLFNKSGITVFVLRYRLPAEGWRNGADVPLQDAQRAMRVIRANAAKFGVDAARIAMMGFSAGGHVAASLLTRFAASVYSPVDQIDRLDARPNLAALLYPVITMGQGAHAGSRDKLLGADQSPTRITDYSCEKHVPADAPPTFLCYAADDETVPPTENGLAMYLALQSRGIKTELHVFAQGKHGFGIRRAQGQPVAQWTSLFLAWCGSFGLSG
jgi:acetyl esterase/lipase